jgi:hypothetical protein
MKNILLFFLLLIIPLSIFAQQLIPLSHKINHKNSFREKAIFNRVKPAVIDFEEDTTSLSEKSLLYRKIFEESLFEIPQKNNKIRIDPIFDLRYGKENSTTLFQNTRGYYIRGYISEKLWFQTSFLENQARFPSYLRNYIDSFAVVPGMIRAKEFKSDGYDYAIAMGQVSFKPSKYYNVQFGQGKHFIGNGYRSLFLSDNSAPYLFLRNNFAWKNWKYSFISSSLINTNLNGILYAPHEWHQGFQKKTAHFKFLSYTLNNTIEIALFESCIFQIKDSTGFNINTLNPLPIIQSIQYGLNDENNTALGLQITAKIPFKSIVYGQFLLDDMETHHLFASRLRNKTAFQLGLKTQQEISSHKFFALIEYNHARPYTYAHSSPQQSFTHYNQALAHPLGANFTEFVAIANYRFKKISLELQYNIINSGKDEEGINYGHNPFQSDDMIYNGSLDINQLTQNQGNLTKISHLQLCFSYLINPQSKLEAFCLLHLRNFTQDNIIDKSSFFNIGIRNNLWNYYTDF